MHRYQLWEVTNQPDLIYPSDPVSHEALLVYHTIPSAESAKLNSEPPKAHENTAFQAVDVTELDLQFVSEDKKPEKDANVHTDITGEYADLGIYLRCVSLRDFCARYCHTFLADKKELMDKDMFLIHDIPDDCFVDDSNKDLGSCPLLLASVAGVDIVEALTPEKMTSEKMKWKPNPETNISKLKQCLKGKKGATVVLEVFRLSLSPDLLPKKHRQSQPQEQPEILKLRLKFPNQEQANEIDERAPKPGLKQEFDLSDAAEKVITLLSRITKSNKWSPCSPNVYG
jgi:hypothetical protein